MSAGPFTVFNLAKPKFFKGSTPEGIIGLASDTFKLALTTSSQALTAAFTGASANAQYSDLTAEVAAGNGYTTGGLTLTSVTFNLATGTITWDAANATWTLTGSGITFAYGVIYDNTASNKDLVCFFNAVAGGGSVSPGAGSFAIEFNTSGIFAVS